MATETGPDLEELLRRQAELLAEAQARLGQETAQRLRLETALRESEEEYRAAFEFAGVGKGETDIHTRRFLRVNQKFCHITGYSNDELLEMTPAEITHPEDRDFDAEQFRRLVVGEIHEFTLEKRYVHKQGGTLWVRLHAAGIHDADGAIKRVSAVIEDITHRKRAEEELRRLVTHARCILWQARVIGRPGWRDGMPEHNTGLHWEIQVQDAHAAQEVLPLEVPEGSNYFVTMVRHRHPDDETPMRARAQTALRAGKQHYAQDFRCFDKFGQQRWLNENVQLEPLGGDRWRAFGVVIDVTARRRAEDTALKQQEMLRDLAAELSRTEERERRRIAVLLHDKVGQALALTQMKLEMVQGQSPADRSLIGEALSLLEQTVADTRSLTCELSPPVLYELGLMAAIEWLSEQVRREHGLAVAIHGQVVPKSLDMELSVLLFQAVRELLHNVVKHAKAHNVAVLLEPRGGDLAIEVQDDGIGFDISAVLAQPPTNRFGLFNVGHRLAAYGGRLEAAASQGQGARLTLIVPIKGDTAGE